jgi:Mg-chelatase subunit ChlI/Mg-chelatase subunit ChlD
MERAKRSLLLHAIDPRIGGTLLLGHRGCAKSTLARGFATLLPPVDSGAVPFVEVPLGVTEDRLLGSVEAERLLESGRWTPRSGLLENAHNGVLYIDEINLLADPVADLLLDSAASGIHRLERDGLSLVRNARYILVATMNPDEGDLRPQLADRFAHSVAVTDAFTPEERVEIGRRRLAFDDDPEAFVAAWSAPTQTLREQLAAARERLLRIETPESLRLTLAQRASAAGLEGMRAELAILRTARASAAFRKATAVDAADIEEAWQLCLGHRQGGSPDAPAHNPPPKNTRESHPEKPIAHTMSTGLPPNTTPPAGSNTSPAPESTRPAGALARTPAEAYSSGIPVPQLVKPRVLSLPKPAMPNRHLTAALSAKNSSNQRFATAQLHRGAIRWQASLTASLKAGWQPGAAGARWRWIRSCPRPVRRLWALLDASRSTGAAQFLAGARDTLATLFRAPLKIHVLLVQGGSVRWLARNASPSKAHAALACVQEAAGKSPLREALLKLHRALRTAQPSRRDTVCICSDGLPTLAPGESAALAGHRLHAAAQKLSRLAPAGGLWLSPAPSRAFAGWLETLLAGSRFQQVRVS